MEPGTAFNYTIPNLINSTISRFSNLVNLPFSNQTVAATFPPTSVSPSGYTAALTAASLSAISNSGILNQTLNQTLSQTLNETVNGARSNHYNLDKNIVNSSNSFLSGPVNGTAVVNGSLLLDCFDLFQNGSCLISSKLGNDSQLLNEFAMPLVQQLIWSFIFGLIVFISTAGNLIICWIILFHRQMRSVTNFHLRMCVLFSFTQSGWNLQSSSLTLVKARTWRLELGGSNLEVLS